MNDTTKNSCPKCGGRFEFNDSDAGSSAPCPHCHASVLLIKKRFPWVTVIGGSMVVVIVCLCLLGMAAEPDTRAVIFGTILFGIVGLGSLGVYFIPTIISMMSKKRNTPAIAVLNIFLGWTLIGWVAALVWAVAQERKD